MSITPDDVARANTLDEINTLYSKATRDYENARQARRKFGSRNTLHASKSKNVLICVPIQYKVKMHHEI